MGAHPLDLDVLRQRFASGPLEMERGPIARGPIPALDPARGMRLRRALSMRAQAQLAGARDSLRRLLAEVPHHPLLVTELGRTLIAQSDWTGVERLARAERASQKDSLLLGHELSEAEERLGRPTDAALVAIEVWAASPVDFEWANATIARLLPADSRATREALRRAFAREPQRTDLARGLARLEWRSRDGAAMVRTLSAVDHAGGPRAVRWSFAEDLLRGGVGRVSVAANDVLMDVVADRTAAPAIRLSAAERVWDVDQSRGTCASGAPAIAKALADLPGEQWDPGFALVIARSLREAGHTPEARALLDVNRNRAPSGDLALERALADLRDGPPEHALPALRNAAAGSVDGAFQYAEALFFSGQCDSALACYQRLGANPAGTHAGAALERVYLIEDADPKGALPAFARACYAAWRGNDRDAAAIAESLYRTLPHRTLWAEAALTLSASRDAAGEPRAALEPLLAVADSLPEDRLAPLARQRAGNLYRDRLHDDAGAVAQYEACLTRYPRAWNAPEVRRALERLRRDRRL
jgi:tetratricopeptide (TPR) repeat protein